ncbi:MAG: IS5 family transposase [Rhizomicrobium sp.]
MRHNLFWLSDEQWRQIELHLPTDVRGKDRVDDRRVISGILHVLKSGCRWCDCPREYGPPTTIYNRFVRWAERGVWERLFRELAAWERSTDTQMIDSTHIKAHRSASGAKKGEQNQAIGRSRGGRNTKIHAIADAKGRLLSILLTGGQTHDCPPAQRLIRRTKRAKKLLGDKAHDSEELWLWLNERGTKAVVPNRSNRKQPFSFDKKSYKQRHRIESAFCRLKDFRRIATRYDRLARNFLASVCLVAAIVWWVL